MKKLLSGAVALAAIVAAGASSAADLGTPAYKAPPLPPAPATYNWTSCYIGAEGGGVWGRSHHTTLSGTDAAPAFDLSGGLAGVESGCNWQFGHIAIGYDGDFSWTNKSGSALSTLNATFTDDTKERWLSTDRFRIGWAQDTWLFYGTFGIASADVVVDDFSATQSASDSHWQWGWAAGAGIEWAFARNWSARVEYLHVDLGQHVYLNPNPVGVPHQVSVTDDLVRVGINYHYDMWALLGLLK